MASPRRVAAEGDAVDHQGAGTIGQPGDFDVLKPVIREPRLPVFGFSAAADVGVGGAGAAEVGSIDRAVGIQTLREAERNPLPRLSVEDRQMRHAGEVLAHVEHIDARLRLGDFLGNPPIDLDDRRTGVGLNCRLDRRADIDGLPLALIKVGLVPLVLFAHVVGFAHQKIGLANRADYCFPVWPSREILCVAVGVLHVQLGQEARIFPVMVALVLIADVAGVPAVGEHRVDNTPGWRNPLPGIRLAAVKIV